MSSEKLIKVKVSNEYREDPFLRQTPGSKGIWKNCQFFFDETVTDCDYWVVYENLRITEKVFCPRGNTLLLTGEPPTVKTYPPKFTNQFTHIITSHTQIKGKDVVISQTALPWHIGHFYKIKDTPQFSKSYDELAGMAPLKKTKTLSVISSAKVMTEGHRKRLDFVKRLKEHFGSEIDVFGAGINPVDDKWNAIADYKYHIVIENTAIRDYWTEKLADCYLAQAFPIYYGCTNLEDYFPAGSYATFDLDDFDQAIKTIESVVQNNTYEISTKELAIARDLVLNKYNFFPLVTEFINSHYSNEGAEEIVIKPFVKKKKSKASRLFMKALHWSIVKTKKALGLLE